MSGLHGENVAPMRAGPSTPRCEHVWVLRNVSTDPKVPGLLLAWRRTREGRWEGWVIHAVPGIAAHGGEPHIHIGWVDAASLEQAN